MPLMKSKSPKAFEHNLKAEMHAGKPQKQALAIAYATKRRAKKAHGGMVNYADGGEVVDHDEVMEGDIDNFLSDEEDSFSPFQDQGIDADTDELSDKYGAPYDSLSDLDNEEGNEDQAQARKGVMESILRRVRMRNMGR